MLDRVREVEVVRREAHPREIEPHPDTANLDEVGIW